MSDSAAAPHSVRHAVESDIPELARLFTVLGHPTPAESLTARWPAWVASGNTALVVATNDGTLLGVITLCQTVVMHRPAPVGRITCLVIDAPARGRGLGRTLVAAAESLLAQAGCGLLEITSNLRRLDAHAFYESLGYERTSVRVVKDLQSPH